ncbi:hypothetical protein [uncultured Capnocytophaga sp.]|uniref:hypothetical protein n=1 Tax=uncultured Capnocytophaga sp. TaxID=159273 RepID=UPI0026059ABA|nr:hypothetical protein [uncultured Capnocytophaga sp.]
MTSEEIKAIVYYIQGLQALWKEGYNAEKVGDYTFNFICRDFRDYNTTNELWEVIDELQFMGEGEEWEKTKEEVEALIQEKLGISIYEPISILSYSTNLFIKQLTNDFSSSSIVLSFIEQTKELITYQEYALALENLLKNLLGKCISIPRDTLAILDNIEDPHIRRLQASLWGI